MAKGKSEKLGRLPQPWEPKPLTTSGGSSFDKQPKVPEDLGDLGRQRKPEIIPSDLIPGVKPTPEISGNSGDDSATYRRKSEIIINPNSPF